MKKWILLICLLGLMGCFRGEEDWEGYLGEFRPECAVIGKRRNIYVLRCDKYIRVIEWNDSTAGGCTPIPGMFREVIIPEEVACNRSVEKEEK